MPSRTPGRGRSGSDPPPDGGCPRCPHEFPCSRTPQRKDGRPQVWCPRSATPPRLRYTAACCEVPRDAKPQTRLARASPSTTAGLRKWLHHSPRTSVHIPQSGPRALPIILFDIKLYSILLNDLCVYYGMFYCGTLLCYNIL